MHQPVVMVVKMNVARFVPPIAERRVQTIVERYVHLPAVLPVKINVARLVKPPVTLLVLVIADRIVQPLAAESVALQFAEMNALWVAVPTVVLVVAAEAIVTGIAVLVVQCSVVHMVA